MTATAKQWEAYQAVKALLWQGQQNVLTAIEGYLARTGPGATITAVDVFNDRVNDWRGGEYLPIENQIFLIELGIVDISAPNEPTVQRLFEEVRLYREIDGWRLKIRLSDYFSEVIGAYIRDKEEE